MLRPRTVAAIDIALHDLCGKALDVPAHQLLGGGRAAYPRLLTLLGTGDPEVDITELERRLSVGFTEFKVKLALGEPDAEVETLRRAAAIVGDAGMVCGDANGGSTEAAAATVLDQLAGSGVAFIEQPVPPLSHRWPRHAWRPHLLFPSAPTRAPAGSTHRHRSPRPGWAESASS